MTYIFAKKNFQVYNEESHFIWTKLQSIRLILHAFIESLWFFLIFHEQLLKKNFGSKKTEIVLYVWSYHELKTGKTVAASKSPNKNK